MLSNLYTTDTGANLYESGHAELTNYIQSIPGLTLGDDIAKSYYLGYLPQDSFPESIFGMTMPILSDDHKTLILNNHVKENRPWGYCYFEDYNSNNISASFQAYYFNSSNQLTRYRTQSWASIRLINKLTMANVSEEDEIDAYIYFRIVPTANLDSNGSGRAVSTVSYTQVFTLETLRKFVNGQISITCNLSQSYVSTSKTVNYSDFDPTTMTYHYTDGDYEVYAQLRSFKMKCGQRYTKSDSSVTPYINVLPFFRTHVPDGYGIPEQDALIVGYDYADVATDFRYETYDYDESQFYADSGNLPRVTGSTGYSSLSKYVYRAKYPLDEIAMEDVVFFTGSGNGIIKNCLFEDAKSPTGKTFAFLPAMDFKDLLKVAMLRNCIQEGKDFFQIVGQTTYDSSMYVSFFNSDDIPYFNDMSIGQWGAAGNYALDSGLLRPWQLPGADITENEFDVDDMPEYNPEPGPGEDTLDYFLGDNIHDNMHSYGATGNFITHWVLTKDQINDFGTYIWTNLLDFDPNDPDAGPLAGVWENIRIAKSTYWTTGSLDPSTLLDLVISLRFFPLDMKGWGSTTGSSIYFGTGKCGVPVTGSAYRLNTLSMPVYAGQIKIPQNSDTVYNDWRDYVDSTAILYIPFCGNYEIPISECVPGDSLDIWYEIDTTSGAMTAYVSAVHGAKYYHILIANGQCGFEVPITATNANRLNAAVISDFQRVIGSVLQPLESAAGKVKTAALGAMSAGSGNMSSQSVAGGDSMSTGEALASVTVGPIAAIGGTAGLETGANLINVATDMMTRPAVSAPLLQGGRGWGALGSPWRPYLQIRRGRYKYPTSFDANIGKPYMTTENVSNVNGYAEAENVNTSGLSCTLQEATMIKQILESGFYNK